MKLNLGCASRRFPDYVNIDLPGTTPRPDVECDILELPYEPGTVDKMIAIHVFEHIYRHKAVAALRTWRGLLRKGGMLILELPCLDKVIRFLSEDGPPTLTVFALYGKNPDGIDALQHKWCWRSKELQDELLDAGFRDVREEECKFHVPARDMRIVGVSP